MFDVSHMLALDLAGAGAKAFLRGLIANDVAKLTEAGKALYSCMLNPRRRRDRRPHRLLPAPPPLAHRRQRRHRRQGRGLDAAHLAAAGFDATLTVRRDLAMIAVQGPNARARPGPRSPAARPPAAASSPSRPPPWATFFIARTGYTGEDGFELTLPADQAAATWNALVAAGVKPCGLGARDTLRLEAGMALYGNDMDETISPLDAGLAWTVDFSDAARDFVGKAALLAKPGQPPGARPGARGQGRAAVPSNRVHRPGRRRNHQRHLLADPRKGHRDGPPAPGRRRRATRSRWTSAASASRPGWSRHPSSARARP